MENKNTTLESYINIAAEIPNDLKQFEQGNIIIRPYSLRYIEVLRHNLAQRYYQAEVDIRILDSLMKIMPTIDFVLYD